ncbi:hypothetical protein [Breoghania sp.]|uniref:hypothetical protein n=1 Tax=Breoghania sp. TaxID=2065378 RepID=UPI002AA8B7A7|nr:hypothetical protein [Breoghania sp.]
MAAAKRAGLSIRAAAKKIGITENALRERIKSGRVVKSILPDGSINAATIVEEYNSTLDVSKARANRSAPVPGAVGFARLKQMKLATDLQISRENLARMKGETVSVEEARAEISTFARLHRDGCLNFASRYGGQIAAEIGADAAAAIAAIDKYMRLHLEETATSSVPFVGGGDGE